MLLPPASGSDSVSAFARAWLMLLPLASDYDSELSSVSCLLPVRVVLALLYYRRHPRCRHRFASWAGTREG